MGTQNDVLKNEYLQDTQNDIKDQNNTYYNSLTSGLTAIPNLIGNGLYSVSNLVKSGWNFVSNYLPTNFTSINNDTIKNVRILSLDGGGTRIYSQAKFLEYFCNDAGITDLGEYFDLIAGTSAGSICATAVANGMKPSDIVTFVKEKTPWVFTTRSILDMFSNNASYPSNKHTLLRKLYLGIIRSYPFYKSVSETSNYGDARLRRELTDIFGDRLLTSLKTSVLLTAYNYSEHNPVIFSNANVSSIPELFRNVKIVDAVMGSISAPIYFPSTQMKLSNNPKEPAYNIYLNGGDPYEACHR